MSIRLISLVYGAHRFGPERSGPTLRAVLLSLADQVDETRHGDWCYPSVQTIIDRTEFGRRTVLRALKDLQEAGWLSIDHRKGFGSRYQFDIAKLEAAQREKVERRLRGTRAFTAPVATATARGALNDAKGCLELLPNKEESGDNREDNQQPIASAPAKKKNDARHMEFKKACEAYAAHKQVTFVWDGSEAKQLSLLLKASPGLTLEAFQRCLNHRGKSAVSHAERPRMWLPTIVRFEAGPLNEFNRPLATSHRSMGAAAESPDRFLDPTSVYNGKDYQPRTGAA